MISSYIAYAISMVILPIVLGYLALIGLTFFGAFFSVGYFFVVVIRSVIPVSKERGGDRMNKISGQKLLKDRSTSDLVSRQSPADFWSWKNQRVG